VSDALVQSLARFLIDPESGSDSQARHVRAIRLPDYFPEYKVPRDRPDLAAFLGASIVAKVRRSSLCLSFSLLLFYSQRCAALDHVYRQFGKVVHVKNRLQRKRSLAGHETAGIISSGDDDNRRCRKGVLYYKPKDNNGARPEVGIGERVR
jgi:hypothetical protein